MRARQSKREGERTRDRLSMAKKQTHGQSNLNENGVEKICAIHRVARSYAAAAAAAVPLLYFIVSHLLAFHLSFARVHLA